MREIAGREIAGRRDLLGGMVALSALAACKPREPDARQGPSRSVAFAIGTPGSDFVLELSVGCADAARQVGWRFSRILNAQPTPDAHINAIRQAVTARNDVVVTVDWYQAVVAEAAKAAGQGTRFAIVQSLNNPEALPALGAPYIGQDSRAVGRELGRRIAATLSARGVTAGSVLVGNPFPGSVNVEDRIAGIGEGLAGVPGLRLVGFADGSASDLAASVALYKARITERGDVVAHAAAAGEMSAVPLLKALGELGAPADKALVAGTVNSLKVLEFIRAGRMAFALDENLYYQGFFAVLLAWSMLERGLPATSMAPGLSWVDAGNVEAVIASYRKRKETAAAYGLS